jgi:hypothetical protein
LEYVEFVSPIIVTDPVVGLQRDVLQKTRAMNFHLNKATQKEDIRNLKVQRARQHNDLHYSFQSKQINDPCNCLGKSPKISPRLIKSVTLGQNDTSLSSTTISRISNILSSFLQQCNIRYPLEVKLDGTFRDTCYADAIQRGFDMKLLKKALDVGIAIADTAYRHLTNHSTRVFVALWTALLTHVDDYYKIYADGLEDFFPRFMRQEPQRYPALDQIVTMIHEIPQHWGTISSNLILTSEMDYLTSSIIDSSIEDMKVSEAQKISVPDSVF